MDGVTVNYVKELNAFFHYRMSKKMTTSEISLLLALYQINNDEDWISWFEADNEKLKRLTGLSDDCIRDTRNKLKQRGRIKFEPGKRNIHAAKYALIPFEDN